MFRTTLGGAMLVLFLVATNGRAQDANPNDQRKGYLGIVVVAENGERGLVIREVAPESPAAKAGLKKGDRVIKIVDEDVKDVDKFLQKVAAHKPGDTLTVLIQRAGKEQPLTVTLGVRPGNAQFLPKVPELPGWFGARSPAFLGVQTQPLTAELKKRLDTSADAGAVVIDIVPNSPAAKAGLKADDIITAIDGRSVEHPGHLREAVQQAGPGKDMELKVVRAKEPLTLKATLRAGVLGQFLTPGDERFPTVDVKSMIDSARRVRELERRVEDLERQLRELQKK